MTGTSAPAIRSKLATILAESVREAERLCSALKTERAALEANDPDALGRATEAKAGPVSALTALDTDRLAVSREAGFGPGPQVMDAVIEWCDEGSVLADDWRRLLDIARECDRQNATNGTIVRLRRRQVMAGLAILRGGDFSAETYAPSGLEENSAGRRALAQA